MVRESPVITRVRENQSVAGSPTSTYGRSSPFRSCADHHGRIEDAPPNTTLRAAIVTVVDRRRRPIDRRNDGLSWMIPLDGGVSPQLALRRQHRSRRPAESLPPA